MYIHLLRLILDNITTTKYPTMKGSIKLIVASLLAAQLSGVMGSHSNRNSQKEQLHRNLRASSRTVKVQADESQRDMQQMHPAEMYDDFFAVPDEIEYAGNEAADDYFLNNRYVW